MGTSSEFYVQPPASISVGQPSQEDTWSLGRTGAVTWTGLHLETGSTDLDSIELDLLAPDGNVIFELADAVAGASTGGTKADVRVPNKDDLGDRSFGGGFKVRVTSTTNPMLTATSGPFTLKEVTTLTLTSPKAGKKSATSYNR